MQEAQTGLNAKAAALEEAMSDAQSASQNVAEAERLVNEAQSILTDAIQTRDAAQDNADSLASELASLRSQYAALSEAISARDTAKSKADQAKAALDAAKDGLTNVQYALSDAQKAKEESADRLMRASALSLEEAMSAPIEDEDFAYLNEYVDAIKNAETDFETAMAKLDTAVTNLLAREDDRDKAQREYLAALADLAIMRDREKQHDSIMHTPHSNSVVIVTKRMPAAATIAMPANKHESDAVVVYPSAKKAESSVSADSTVPTEEPASSSGAYTIIDHSSDQVAKAAPVKKEENHRNNFPLFAGIFAGVGFIAILAKKRKNKEKAKESI